MLLLPATTKFRTHKKTAKVTKPSKVWQSSKLFCLKVYMWLLKEYRDKIPSPFLPKIIQEDF